ncbi:hypothetical protein [Streptomyces sp. 4F14]|uniref:hypothetical protein n=1 Tax=Streptomyces sp. 4F14 TaxID=3394380 RepID=UPI003A85BBAE
MSSPGSSPVRGGWLDPSKGFHADVQPRKRQLAFALRSLCRLLRSTDPHRPGDTPPLLREAAKRLGCTQDSLSRYLNRARIPRAEFIKRLYDEARADATASGQEADITLEALLALHTSALDEQRGRDHPELDDQLDVLTEQIKAPCAACENRHQKQQRDASRLRSVRREITRLRTEVAELKAERSELRATEAGLRADLAALRAQPLLPVPRPPRDRQQRTKDTRAARQLVAQATELSSTGREDLASTLIRQTTAEVMTPAETALVVVGLRQHPGGDQLADDLIHVYGRDQEKEDVMAVAVELHDEGAADDAGAILRASLGHRAGVAPRDQAASASYRT